MVKWIFVLFCFFFVSVGYAQENNISLPNYKNHKIFDPYTHGVYHNGGSQAYVQVGYRTDDSYEFSIYAGPINTDMAMNLFRNNIESLTSYTERNVRLAIYVDKKTNKGYLYQYSRSWYKLGRHEWKLVKEMVPDYQEMHKEIRMRLLK